MRIIDLMLPAYSNLMVVSAEFDTSLIGTLLPSTEAVKFPLTRVVGIVMAADIVVPMESAIVKLTAPVPWSNVSPETDESELTKM